MGRHKKYSEEFIEKVIKHYLINGSKARLSADEFKISVSVVHYIIGKYENELHLNVKNRIPRKSYATKSTGRIYEDSKFLEQKKIWKDENYMLNFNGFLSYFH